MSVEQQCWLSFAWTKLSDCSSTAKSLGSCNVRGREKQTSQWICAELTIAEVGIDRKSLRENRKADLVLTPFFKCSLCLTQHAKSQQPNWGQGTGSEYSWFICLIHRKHFMPDQFWRAMYELFDYKLNVLEAVMFYKSPSKSAVSSNKGSAKFLNSWAVIAQPAQVSAGFTKSLPTQGRQRRPVLCS